MVFNGTAGILCRDFGMLSLSFTRSFSGSSVVCGAKAMKYLKAQNRRQLNEARQSKIKSSLDSVDPVLGKKDTQFIVRVMAELKEPKVLARGYEHSEVEKLIASIEASKNERLKVSGLDKVAKEISLDDSAVVDSKREAVLRILSMRNADNKTAMKAAIKLTREEFQRFPGDTGSSEVQAAVMTVRIHNLAKHVQDNKKDNKNTRTLRMLVQQRQSLLRYLKRDNPERYFWTIEKLGLTDNAVVSEFNMDRRYMQDYQFFGDRILIKDSKKVAGAKRKAARREKRLSQDA
ncbi:mitochondrial 37S ribosomal protein uS15m Ecym_7465 [Eremothecium cymbalariae DBVPG|uniref:37S ribosomal protein S28, mitochondrial n=1 Tax=Eremothecium cymbalariae (strain CBS 270.75 / DBVPG 7215 / KCTC 17166 / NRRL Y-17582) TaxID=931890 RepID=G8JWR9_ERECY|nr:hypothetical protein Ecym_7465 [Eremothecium cymbalariae DBVPG\